MIFKSPLPDIQIPEVDLFTFIINSTKCDGSKSALIDAITEEVITYNELFDRTYRLAAGLHQYGFHSQDILGIYSPNHIEYPIAVFASLLLGNAVTTANPTYTPDELNFQLSDSGATVLVTIPELLPSARKAIQGTKVREIFVFGKIGEHNARPLRSLEVNGLPPKVEIKDPKTRTAILCYSSGTTGKPKGVETTHYNLISNILQLMATNTDLTPNDVWCATLPFYHCYALVVILLAGIYNRFSIVSLSKFDLERYLSIIQKYKVTLAHIVPPIAIGLAKSPITNKYDLSSLRMAVSGAAPLGADTEIELSNKLKNCVVKQGYGMTELSPLSHSPYEKIVPGSVGILAPNQMAKIVDPTTGKELGIEQEGELWIKGPNVMKGYLNRPDATAETIDKDGYLHTGDIAKVDKDGNFYITDRLKELIKVKGLQVAPAELEAYLLTHPLVADSAVIGIPEERAGEAPKAFVVLKPGTAKSDQTAKEIIEFIDKKVAPHKRLKGGLEFMDVIPKSPSGKILRRVLKDMEKEKAKQKAKL